MATRSDMLLQSLVIWNHTLDYYERYLVPALSLACFVIVCNSPHADTDVPMRILSILTLSFLSIALKDCKYASSHDYVMINAVRVGSVYGNALLQIYCACMIFFSVDDSILRMYSWNVVDFALLTIITQIGITILKGRMSDLQYSYYKTCKRSIGGSNRITKKLA